MGQFRQLMRVALIAGTLSGALLFVYQYFVVVPRIIAAEAYESGELQEDHHEHDTWKPQEGLQRNILTAASTVLTGIGFAALLVSAVMLAGTEMNSRRGALWGLAGFICFVAAPALELPPVPPGVRVTDLAARQLWWFGTAAATAIGLFLIFDFRTKWLFKLIGGMFFVLPHVVGAPRAVGAQVIPERLVQEFAIVSIVGNGLFWVSLGVACGFLMNPVKRPTQ